MDKTLKEIGKKIRFHRKGAGYSGEELASRAGLTTTYISRVENGLVPGVSLDTILRISRALNVPVSVLLGESEVSQEAIRTIGLLKELLKNEEVLPKETKKHKKHA